MELCDYHIHSICSDDGHFTMAEMALASYKQGVRRLCFTDHCDLDDYMTGYPKSDSYSHRERSISMYKDALAVIPPDMKLFLGMELGEGNHAPVRAAEIAASEELDFVLGSLHNLENIIDFYEMRYESYEQCIKLMDEYADELIDLSKMDFFDVMAHIGYTIRYMRRDGFDVSFDIKNFGDKTEAILKNLIERGKGIEINCSGYRTKTIGAPIPSEDILRLYKKLGGEIITIGSDAHRTNQAGKGLTEGLDTLRTLGYKYYTVFEKRKPEFIKL